MCQPQTRMNVYANLQETKTTFNPYRRKKTQESQLVPSRPLSFHRRKRVQADDPGSPTVTTGGGSGGAPATSASGGCGDSEGSGNAPAIGTSCRCITDDAGSRGSGEDYNGSVTAGACCRDADRVTAGDTRGRGCADGIGCGGVGTAASAGGRSCLATL